MMPTEQMKSLTDEGRVIKHKTIHGS